MAPIATRPGIRSSGLAGCPDARVQAHRVALRGGLSAGVLEYASLILVVGSGGRLPVRGRVLQLGGVCQWVAA